MIDRIFKEFFFERFVIQKIKTNIPVGIYQLQSHFQNVPNAVIVNIMMKLV